MAYYWIKDSIFGKRNIYIFLFGKWKASVGKSHCLRNVSMWGQGEVHLRKWGNITCFFLCMVTDKRIPSEDWLSQMLICIEEQEKLRHCNLKWVFFGRLCTVNCFSFHKLLGSWRIRNLEKPKLEVLATHFHLHWELKTSFYFARSVKLWNAPSITWIQ